MFLLQGRKNPWIKNEAVLCAEPFRGSAECLLFEHPAFQAAFPPQPDKWGFFWELAVSTLGQPRQLEPRELQQPQLLLYPSPAAAAKKIGFKETTARSSLCPALFETKMNFKAAPTPPALVGRGWNVGGRGVAIPAWILMFHPATHV